MRSRCPTKLPWLACTLAFACAGPTLAQPLPLSFEASPDMYKIAAQSDTTRLIEATWKPGQRDKAHRHPANLWYVLTPCSLRFHTPDGVRDITLTPGRSGAQPAVQNHEVENVGQADCRMLMIEPK